MLCLMSGFMVMAIAGSSDSAAFCKDDGLFFNVPTKLEKRDFSKKSGELIP